jgi:hypothetical protein
MSSVKTRKQIASEYKINIRTFNRWVKESGITLPKGLIYPNKVEEIYQRFGRPENANR